MKLVSFHSKTFFLVQFNVALRVQFNVALRPETVRTVGDGLGLVQDGHLDFHTAPELCLEELVLFQGCFTSAETIRFIRDGKPRTATSTFIHLLNSVQVSDGTRTLM